MTLSELGTPVSIATLALAIAGLIWKGGRLSERVEQNDKRHERDLKKLEESHGRELRELKTLITSTADHSITRDELDARFGEVKAQLTAVRERMDDVVSIFKEALRR